MLGSYRCSASYSFAYLGYRPILLISLSFSQEKTSVVQDYISQVTSDVALTQPLKVAVDCGNGIAGKVAPQLLQALGCEVIGFDNELNVLQASLMEPVDISKQGISFKQI